MAVTEGAAAEPHRSDRRGKFPKMIEHQRYTICPVCDADRIEDRYVVKGYTISWCATCDGFFVRQILTIEELNAFYAAQEDDYVYDCAQNLKNLRYYYGILREIIEVRRPRRGRILDIGCSAGQFLEMMVGWERHGTEIIPKQAAIARNVLGDTIHVGPIEDYPQRENFFDVITLQDVFDHFIDPRANLERCFRMLKPGGLIVIKVHDIRCLYARLSGARFYAIDPPGHLFFFSRKPLSLMVQRAGFTFLEHRHIAQKLYLKTIFYRLARGGRQSLPHRIYRLLEGSRLGNISIRKNLHDIITVFAEKPRG